MDVNAPRSFNDDNRAASELTRLRKQQMQRDATELATTARLQEVGDCCVRATSRMEDCLLNILDAAIFLTNADKGTVQLFDQASGWLRIAAQRGFEQPFLNYFSSRDEVPSACSSALHASSRVVVEDVTHSEIFAGTPSLQVLLDAGIRAVQSTPLLSSSGKVLGMVSTHFSVPHRPSERELGLMDLLARQAAEYLERKRADAALKNSAGQLRRFLEVAATGLTRCGRDLRYIEANPAYAEIMGLPLEQIIGRRIIDVKGKEAWEKVRPYVERVLAGERVEYEMVLPFPEHGPRHVHVVYVPETNGAREVVGWVGSMTDITEPKRIEAQLRKLEKLAAAGQLAASLAHEINNPLSTVLDALYVLDTYPGLDPVVRSLVTAASTEMLRLGRIVRQSLSYYRRGATPQELDLSVLLGESLQIFSEKLRVAGIEVVTRITPKTIVTGFGDEIRQAIDNLLLNAMEATPRGGRLMVSLRSAHQWKDQERGGVRLTIGDTGSGIPREYLSNIFDAFFTTKSDKGTGLGLWVVRGIVEKHHGTIRCRSRQREGRSGTVFSILWPADEESEPDERPADGELAA